MVYVPPGGFAGWNQMTPASKAGQAGGKVRGASKRRRKSSKKRASSKRTTKRRTTKRASGRKPKFGSPAWRKKYMKR